MSGPELKPCPFCGGALDYAEPVTYVHTIGKCILSGRNFKAGYIGQWNRRAPDPAQIRADALREAAAKLAEIYDRGLLSWPQYQRAIASILALLDTLLSPTAVDGSPAPDAGGKEGV